jgi:histidinol-phosphate aminotransferase
VLAAWEEQRTADPRKYGLNRYPDFVHTDLLAALSAHHGPPPTNFTPLAGNSEVGTVLAAALLRGEGATVVGSWPIGDPISRPARAWGARVKRVPLNRNHAQDLKTLAAAVDGQTALVQLQNPHDPSGTSIGQADFEDFLAEVSKRNPNAYVWVDESYAPYSLRSDFPDSYALIAEDPESSKLCVTRTLETAHGMAAVPTAYLAASRMLTVETEGIANGFVAPDVYGWAGPEANVGRLGEKALLAVLGADGEAHLDSVRGRNEIGRKRLVGILETAGFTAFESDGSFVFAKAPGPYRQGGISAALAQRGVRVRPPRRWGKRYRGFIRVSVGSERELAKLERALVKVLGAEKQASGRQKPPSARRTSTAAARRGSDTLSRRDLGLLRGNGGGGLTPIAAAAPMLGGKGFVDDPRVELTRRDFAVKAGLGVAGMSALLNALGAPRVASAFPPDSTYDTRSMARMIYHENPVGPSPAALEAIAEELGRGRRAAQRFESTDDRELVTEILRYNHRSRGSVARLGLQNVMLLDGSAEGLMLTADTFVAGGTLVSEWPCYRIIRERVWQGDGTVIDVQLDPATWRPDYDAMKEALSQNPGTGLIHFNAQNNPAGTVLRRDEFDPFARWVFRNHPQTVILVDESDPEYMQPGLRETMPDFPGYVARGENLVHLQTFSHVFALTGLRIGYLFAAEKLIRKMRAKRINRPVINFARVAALASLRDHREQVRRSYRIVEAGRNYLYSEFDDMGIDYLPSQGQYVLFDTGAPSGTAVWAALVALGILTRFGNEWGMERWVRVCPGLPDENERFVQALRTVLLAPRRRAPSLRSDGGLPRSILPRTGEGEAMHRSLDAALRRTATLDSRMPPFRGALRETPAAALRR